MPWRRSEKLYNPVLRARQGIPENGGNPEAEYFPYATSRIPLKLADLQACVWAGKGNEDYIFWWDQETCEVHTTGAVVS